MLAHELSHHLGLHTVGLTIGHWLSLPVVLLARIGFWLQNVATAATDTFAQGSSALTDLRAARGRRAQRAVAAVRRRPLRRRRARQRGRPPLRVPGRPPRGADGVRPQPRPRPAPGDQHGRRPAPRRLAGPPRRVAPPGPHARGPHRRHAPPPAAESVRSGHGRSRSTQRDATASNVATMSARRVGGEDADQVAGATPRSRPRRPPLT